MMVRGQYAQLLAPGVHHNFVEWLDTYQREVEYEHLFNTETSEKAYEDEVQYAGLGPMPEKTENSPTAYNDAIQGGSKRYVHLTYALGARSSWELYEDDVYGIIKQIPKALARSAQFTKEMVAWNILNLGFTTVKTTDGLSLFNTAHPLLGGPAATNIAPGVGNIINAAGTYPNRPNPDVDMSFTALQLMTNMFERMPDSQGLPIVVKVRHIVGPPEIRFILRELLGSPGKPGTGDNDINSLIGEDLTYMIPHYLTGTSPWFAFTPKEGHQLKFFTRHPIDTDYDDDFDTRSLKQISFMRISAGATHWLGTFGSNGP